MDSFSDDWLIEIIETLAKDGYRKGLDEAAITNIISEAISTSLLPAGKEVADSLRKRMHTMLNAQRYIHDGFISRLSLRWFEGIDLLEAIIVALTELGEDINGALRAEADKKNLNLIEVMTRFHARAARISREALCLIKNGFADGALSRWRSIHELSVLSYFILENGDDLAKLFLDYSDIERFEELQTYQKHAGSLGFEEISSSEAAAVKQRKDRLVAEHSAAFAGRYGWTYKVLDREKRNFAGIEESVQLDYLRPFYKMASRSLHSTAKGIFWDVGMHERARESLLLAGETNYGFTDPAQNTAISFLQVSSCVFMLKPSITRLAGLKAVENLIDEMQQKFIAVQKQIESEEAEKKCKRVANPTCCGAAS